MNLTGQSVYAKGNHLVSKPARQQARQAKCTLRLQGCTCGKGGNVVLCHLRRFGWAGTAHKPADYKAVFACDHCHPILDGPQSDPRIGDDDIIRALGETLDHQFANGVFKA